jgi:putative transposase
MGVTVIPHLILLPPDADGLRRALAPMHRRYAGIVHARRKRTGHFWQGRFGCVAMDEEHLAAALRYVSLNPVRARLVDRARDWRWSSVRAHLGGRDDGVTTLAPVRERYPDFANFLSEETDAEMIERLRSAETIGRPLGNRKFLDMFGTENEARSQARQTRAEAAYPGELSALKII